MNTTMKLVPNFYGTMTAPKEPPVDGFMLSFEFLDKKGLLTDNLVSSLHSCGISLKDQDGRSFDIRPSGLFANGEVSADAKELLSIMAKEGWEGDLSYKIGREFHQITLTDGFYCSTENEPLKNYRYG